jgi:hypothetical protein
MGLVGMVNVLALEGARYDIKVNAIAPVARTRMTEDLLGPLAEKLNPEQISPVVAWLASEDCPVSGEVYSCGGGTVSRFFVGLTKGIVDADLTVETIRDRWDEIRDQADYDDFADNGGEIRKLARLFRD